MKKCTAPLSFQLILTKLRFDALAGYIRAPQTALFSDELEWYSEANERILAVLLATRFYFCAYTRPAWQDPKDYGLRSAAAPTLTR